MLIEYTGITEDATDTLLAVVRTGHTSLEFVLQHVDTQKVPIWYARMRTTLGKWERPMNL